MEKKMTDYIAAHKMGQFPQPWLVGLSGGVDSVVLVHLLKAAAIDVVLAHCHFHLRGQESDRDAAFVRQLAKEWNLPLLETHFNTKEVAQKRRVSIEMAARDLRYEWFENMRVEHGCGAIAVAHHRDDNLETFFLNLVRGSGLQGLSGMNPVNGHVIRPLLWAGRHEIEAHAVQNGLAFCHDSTNDEVVYRRNKIRHEVLPMLEELNPSFRDTLGQTMERLDQTNTILKNEVEKVRQVIEKRENGTILFPLDALMGLEPNRIWLYELLSPYGFKDPVIAQIIESFSGQSGKVFFSSTYQLVKDRDYLILSPLSCEGKNHSYEILPDQKKLEQPLPITLELFDRGEDFQLLKDPKVALIDADKIIFPLALRKWQEGDYFCPIGMKGRKKKLSDFFVNQKFSLTKKQNTWLLCSGHYILWVVGHRTDDRFKITPATRRILKITLL